MADELRLTYTAATVLQSIGGGYRYGFDVMQVTGFPSGTVYPALRRLERGGLIAAQWEAEEAAAAEHRPPRKYYTVTQAGEEALLSAVKRYPLLEQAAPPRRG